MTETEYTLSLADFKAAQRLRIGASLSTMVRYYAVVYSVIDLGNSRDGGLIQQAGGPLAGEICWSKESVTK